VRGRGFLAAPLAPVARLQAAARHHNGLDAGPCSARRRPSEGRREMREERKRETEKRERESGGSTDK